MRAEPLPLIPRLAFRVPRLIAACGPISRGVPLKPGRLQAQILPRGPAFALRASARQANFWSVNRTSGPGLGANECELSGLWCESTALRHLLPLQELR